MNLICGDIHSARKKNERRDTVRSGTEGRSGCLDRWLFIPGSEGRALAATVGGSEMIYGAGECHIGSPQCYRSRCGIAAYIKWILQ